MGGHESDPSCCNVAPCMLTSTTCTITLGPYIESSVLSMGLSMAKTAPTPGCLSTVVWSMSFGNKKFHVLVYLFGAQCDLPLLSLLQHLCSSLMRTLLVPWVSTYPPPSGFLSFIPTRHLDLSSLPYFLHGERGLRPISWRMPNHFREKT